MATIERPRTARPPTGGDDGFRLFGDQLRFARRTLRSARAARREARVASGAPPPSLHREPLFGNRLRWARQTIAQTRGTGTGSDTGRPTAPA